jgi:type IV pilus assembly protein PilA
MEPGLVWLMLIPLFNLIWQFLVVIALSNSLRNEFRARGVSNIEPEPGKSIGIALSICAACGIVPFVNFVAFPVQLILLVVYWSKIAGFSRMLDQVPAPNVTAPYTPQDLPPNMPFAQPGTVWAPPPPNLDTRRRVPVFVWILVGFAGFIPIVAILMLIAIPTVGSLKKKANDLSAQQAIRAIHEAEIQYQSTYPSSGFACTLPALGGQPASGAPSPVAAQVLQDDLASGYKSGYIFTLTCKDEVTVSGTDRFVSYTVTAVPQTVGKTGDRGFCSDEGGAISFDPAGGTNCTERLVP